MGSGLAKPAAILVGLSFMLLMVCLVWKPKEGREEISALTLEQPREVKARMLPPE